MLAVACCTSRLYAGRCMLYVAVVCCMLYVAVVCCMLHAVRRVDSMLQQRCTAQVVLAIGERASVKDEEASKEAINAVLDDEDLTSAVPCNVQRTTCSVQRTTCIVQLAVGTPCTVPSDLTHCYGSTSTSLRAWLRAAPSASTKATQ
jgi:hypothetical protein